LNRLATDVCLFMNQHFAFVSFPDDLTTGSSIMPHKKNPDVFELIRAKTNQIQAIPTTVSLLLTNMSTGYHRDLQLLKEEIFPGIERLKSCLSMSTFMLKSIRVRENILQDPFYKHLFSVEVVNELVLQGVPFRDAYKQVGLEIEADQFAPNQSQITHTHEGSIGNLGTEAIRIKMGKALEGFQFQKIDSAVNDMLK
jgi:argininosuccinate lyase